MTARIADINGFITIKGNPLSKVGVFQYSGAQIGHPDTGRIFNVYRPAEELADPECIESFKLVPFVNEHEMLGSEEEGMTPAERKGVEGMVGEDVYFDPPYLRGNLRIVSESLKNAIGAGKIELSPGYRCVYELTPGVFEGQPYDAVQRKIRANHLALVQEGRTGPDVRVLDSFTIDTKEIAAMAEQENQQANGGESLGRIRALLDELKPLLAEQEQAREMLKELGIKMDREDESEGEREMEVEKMEDQDPAPAEPAADMCKDEDKIAAAMDKALRPLMQRIANLEKGVASMDSALVSGIADRDVLASRLSQFVGTFDSAKMTAADVAKYGVEKLGIPCAAGAERIALDAWLHGREPEYKKPAVAQDGKRIDIISAWGAK